MPVVSCTITTRAVNKPTIGLSMEEEMTIRFHGSCISVVEKFVFSGTTYDLAFLGFNNLLQTVGLSVAPADQPGEKYISSPQKLFIL